MCYDDYFYSIITTRVIAHVVFMQNFTAGKNKILYSVAVTSMGKFTELSPGYLCYDGETAQSSYYYYYYTIIRCGVCASIRLSTR